MIEALVAYIEDQGYTVDVRPGYLCIRKIIDDQICSVSWWIDHLERRYAYPTTLYTHANHYISLLEQAIQQKRSGVPS